MDNHFDRRERTIYVWMLERSVTDDQLYTLFSKIGPIEKLIFKEYADGTPQHCLIVFRYVDSVLTAMSTLQGSELNGKSISLRPLRESTHAVLMPPSTMYPSKDRRATMTSSDGPPEDHSEGNHGGGDVKKLHSNWDVVSTAGSDSSYACKIADGLESATEKLTLDEICKGTVGSRSCTSHSSISSGAGSPSHSLSPPPKQQQQYHPHPPTHSAIHGSLRKPWRPSRGPIPAPLLTPGGFASHHLRQFTSTREDYSNGEGGGMHSSHANLAHHSASSSQPPSLFSQIIPASPMYGSVSPHTTGPFHSAFDSGAVPSPRPLLPEMYRPASRPAASMGVFSPTVAPEEVLWRQHHGAHPPLRSGGGFSTPLMSPPCTSGGRNWFDYGEYSVPQAYRGSGTDQQFAVAAATVKGGCGQATNHTPLSLGGMLPPNSPPIGQCSPFFDFTSAAATLPRLRLGGPPSSARPQLLSPFVSARSATRAPRSAAPLSTNPTPFHGPHPNSPFAWPDFRTFGGRY